MKIRKFFNEVIAELKKVSWPGKKEVIVSTNVVITLSVLAGLYIFVVDKFFGAIVKNIIN